jgi:hypothetical protein
MAREGQTHQLRMCRSPHTVFMSFTHLYSRSLASLPFFPSLPDPNYWNLVVFTLQDPTARLSFVRAHARILDSTGTGRLLVSTLRSKVILLHLNWNSSPPLSVDNTRYIPIHGTHPRTVTLRVTGCSMLDAPLENFPVQASLSPSSTCAIYLIRP